MCLLTVGFTGVWGAESRFVLRVMWGEVRFQKAVAQSLTGLWYHGCQYPCLLRVCQGLLYRSLCWLRTPRQPSRCSWCGLW